MGKGGGGSGGGGSPAPSSQVISNTSIPAYAQPYVENMLGQTAALTDVNQNPYQTYGGQRLASFTPLQNSAFNRVANQQVAGQLATGTNMATAGGAGLLGVAGQAANTGANYANMATNPYSMQQYMSPYIQNALQPQLQEMQRQYGITGLQEKAQATGMGAFGGSREALMRGENERNKNIAMNQAIGQGYQNAFQAAQQAQQYGANLGLQGQQAAMSGLGQAVGAAGTLGQLGQTQYGQETGITQAQLAAGNQQQQQQQMALDIAYQDFLKQQNYPYQQQAFMSDMLRGLPMSQSAQTQYTAPPSLASQMGGLGMTGMGIYGMSGGFKAKGGMVGEGYAEGGAVGYAGGGKLESMSDSQLQAMLSNPKLSLIERDQIENILALHRRMEMNPETPKIMGGGVDTIPSGDTFEAAGGGIVAFSKGGSSDGYDALEKAYFDKALQRLKEPASTADPFAESKATEEDIRAQLAESKRMSPYQALAMAGLGTMAGTSQYGLTNLGLGGIQGMKSMGESKAEQDQLNKLLLQQSVEREKSQFARQMAREGQADTAVGALIGKRSAAEIAAATRGATASSTENANIIRAQNSYNNAIDKEKRSILSLNKQTYTDINDPQLDADAKRNVDAKLTPPFRKLLEMPGMMVEDKAVPGTSASPLPMPKSAAEAIKGKVYNTRNGPATWDGKQFVGI